MYLTHLLISSAAEHIVGNPSPQIPAAVTSPMPITVTFDSASI